MAAEKDIIVALELATTSIRAIAGQRMPDGTMQVLAFAEENAANCIRKGIIDNIDKTTQAISRVLGQIGLQLGQTISRIYVGLSGQSLHSVHNHIQRAFTEKTQISNGLIDQLMDTNRGVVYTNSEILEVIPQEYKVGNRAVPDTDIVGMQIEQLEANFLNIIARNSLAENIENCVNSAGYEIAELLITPLALGDSILNASEKRSGCALVDLGADTTTVSIYSNNILRKLVVIPMGSHNATMDIAHCLKIEVEEAESLKMKYGHAWYEDYEGIQNKVLQLSHGRETNESRLCEIIEARYEEILHNVWAQLEEDSEKLTSGIIFTGGGAQIASLSEAFKQVNKRDKQIRIVKGMQADVCMTTTIYVPDNGRINNIISLLLHGDQNCVTFQPESDKDNNSDAPTEEDKKQTPDTTQDTEKQDNLSTTHVEEEENAQEEEQEQKKKKRSFWQIIKDAVTDEE